MSLIACAECKAQISKKASACPSCGAPVKAPKRQTSIFTWCVVALIVLAFYSAMRVKRPAHEAAVNSSHASQQAVNLTPEQREAEQKSIAEKSAKAAEQQTLNSARYVCQEFVRNNLNDPKSAEFERHRSFWAERQPSGTYLVQVRVRAKNAFGATMLSVFECETGIENENWVPLKIKQVRT